MTLSYRQPFPRQKVRHPLRRRSGFSLFELLLVMGVLAVLAGISFAAFRTTTERSRSAQASAQIQRLGIALEQYRNQYGDFPMVPPGSSEAALHMVEALLGERSPAGTPLDPPERNFLDLEEFSKDEENPRQMASLDPWGNPWVYAYAPSLEDWVSRGFILYSRGPSGDHRPPEAEGAFNPDHPQNRDNIFYE